MGFFSDFFAKMKAKNEEKKKQKEAKKAEENEKKYIEGLALSRNDLQKKLKKLSKKSQKISQDFFDELEELLIETDIGVDYTFDLIERLMVLASEKKIKESSEVEELLFDLLYQDYNRIPVPEHLNFQSEGPAVFLITGVNGVGKTTSIAKLAYLFKSEGKKVLLIGADTFRAGAATQLEVWANRLEIDSVEGKLGTDPSSIIYDGLTKALNQKYDLVLIDVAGRLTTKTALMDELKKIDRVIKKKVETAPHETLLVLDANLGQNGITQAKVFQEVLPLTGVILTKMDGTSKGGIALAIKRQFRLPIRYIGLGEKPEDLIEFDIEYYLQGLLEGKEADE